MNETSPSNRSPSDADWLAMRYALDELDQAEQVRFEARLANDQHARDRLVEAVSVLEACGARASRVALKRAPRPTPRRNRRQWLAVAGAIACLAATIGVWSMRSEPRTDETAVTATPSTRETVEIVSRWADSSADPSQEEFPLENDSAGEMTGDWLPPEWLLAAVAHEQLAAPEATPFEADPVRIEGN